MDPRSYQRAGLDSACNFFASGNKSGVVNWPTGLGKTVFIALARKWLIKAGLMSPGGRVLVIAHRDELLQQAKKKIERANPGLKVAVEKAADVACLKAEVVVASVQSLGTKAVRKRLERFPKDHFELVITDEAHHATADSYQAIYDYFDWRMHVGCTATAYRSDNSDLKDVYDGIIHKYGLKEAIEDGWLARPVGFKVQTSTDISAVNVRRGEFVAKELEQAVDTPARNLLLARAYQTLCGGERTVVFCAGREHLQNALNAFLSEGISAACVDGETPIYERRAIYEKFHDGTIRVLLNCGVLLEGFDEVLVKNIIMARPTRSPLVYTQAVGRGSRMPAPEDGGSEFYRGMFKTFRVIDIVDAGKKISMNVFGMFGVKTRADCGGKDVIEQADQLIEFESKGHDISELDSVDSARELLVEEKEFKIPEISPAIKKNSVFLWQRLSDGSFYLPLPDKDYAYVEEDLLGKVQIRGLLGGKEFVHPVKAAKSPEKALRRADRYLLDNAPESEDGRKKIYSCQWFWIEKEAGKKPATKAQLQALRRWRVKHPRGIRKGEASMLLSRAIAIHRSKGDQRKSKRASG